MGARQMLNQGLGRVDRLTRYAANTAKGRIEALRNSATGPKAGMSDETITRKVESELFRDPEIPKGHIVVNTVEGVVQLRGEVKRPAVVKAIEVRVRAVPEVRDVENLLHLPKTPANASKPRRSQASRSGGRFNTEVKTAPAEPTPAELAEKGSGRTPPPMGSQGEPTEGGTANQGATGEHPDR
jgi:hypothetical protein